MSQIAEEGRRPVHLGVMVRAEQRRELRERAEQEDRSVSSVTRAAIDACLERERERRRARYCQPFAPEIRSARCPGPRFAFVELSTRDRLVRQPRDDP